jgi:hypothetical protein
LVDVSNDSEHGGSEVMWLLYVQYTILDG